jgi:hypothetical protein
MKVLNHIPGPTFFSQLSRIYPVQSLAPTGFYGVYNSYPPSTIIRNPNQIFSNSFAQYNSILPSINYSYLPIVTNPIPANYYSCQSLPINYSYLPIVTNPIPANYYSCQSLPINYSFPHLSCGSHYNLRSTNYSSLPICATYQSLNPPIPPIFYAPQSSNLPHNFGSSNLSNFNVSSYGSNQVEVDSNPPIEFTDNFSMRIKKADDSYDTLNLKQIAGLVPNGFTGGILEPEIDSSNNKLKICNSVILTVVQRKIWIRNGDNLVELPNHLLEKNLNSSPKIYPTIIPNDTRSDVKQTMPFPKIMTAFTELNKSLIRVDQITKLEREILEASSFSEDFPTLTQNKELTSISNSTTPSSPTSPLSLSLSPSPSPSPPSSSINPKFEIMTLTEKMVNGEDLKEYGLGSKFIIRLTKKPELTGEAILC